MLLSVSGCINTTSLKYADLLFYLRENLDIDVFFVQELLCDEENKCIYFSIAVDSEDDVSLDELIAIRDTLNEYLAKDESSYLNEGWAVQYRIQNGENTYLGSLPYKYSAYFSNRIDKESRYINQTVIYGELSDELDVIWFELDEEDIPYITGLSDMRHIEFCGNYVDLDDDVMYETIEQIRNLNGLKSVSIYTEWYDAFIDADLNCKVYEDLSSRNDREL